MGDEVIYRLIEKYRNETISDEERLQLLAWYREVAEKESYFSEEEEQVEALMLNRLMDSLNRKKPILRYKRAVLAIAVLLIFGGIFTYFNSHSNRHTVQQAVLHEAVAGGDKAVLTLADGTRISLTDIAQGQVAQQNGVTLTKTADEQLLYSAASTPRDEEGEMLYNQVETPHGGQYRLRLPDGTKVWLNAGSSIKFPVDFSSEKDRVVLLTGEAYFEVAKDELHPFKVEADHQLVEVLGTRFNMNTFRDQSGGQTTLLDGAIKVSSTKKVVILKPGQTVAVYNGMEVSDADSAVSVAWVSGYFRFNDEKLESVMQKIGRWYDVEVIYRDAAAKEEIMAAAAKRSSRLSTLLNMMEQTSNVRFEIKNKQVLVSKSIK